MPPRGQPDSGTYDTLPDSMPLIAGILPYLQDDLQDRVMQAFSYEFDFTGAFALGAGGSNTVSVTIDNTSHFICTSITAQIFTGSNPPTSVSPAPVTMQINDTGSGQTLFFPLLTGALLGNVSGIGQLPFQFTVPRQFSAASQLSMLLTSFDTSRAFTGYVTLNGARIFGLYRSGAQGGTLPALTY